MFEKDYNQTDTLNTIQRTIFHQQNAVDFTGAKNNFSNIKEDSFQI